MPWNYPQFGNGTDPVCDYRGVACFKKVQEHFITHGQGNYYSGAKWEDNLDIFKNFVWGEYQLSILEKSWLLKDNHANLYKPTLN